MWKIQFMKWKHSDSRLWKKFSGTAMSKEGQTNSIPGYKRTNHYSDP